MIKKQFTVEIEQPYLSLLEIEAAASRRTVAQHLQHIIGRRYDSLIRICRCGYFLYHQQDDLRCALCGKQCCSYCSAAVAGKDLCSECAAENGVQSEPWKGFRASPEEKV